MFTSVTPHVKLAYGKSLIHNFLVSHVYTPNTKLGFSFFKCWISTFMPYYGLFWTESPYPDLQWRFPSEHYFLWDHIVDNTFLSHYDITIANDVAMDVHCDLIIGHDVVMGKYHDVTMQTDVARMLTYVLLHPIMIFIFSVLKC